MLLFLCSAKAPSSCGYHFMHQTEKFTDLIEAYNLLKMAVVYCHIHMACLFVIWGGLDLYFRGKKFGLTIPHIRCYVNNLSIVNCSFLLRHFTCHVIMKFHIITLELPYSDAQVNSGASESSGMRKGWIVLSTAAS